MYRVYSSVVWILLEACLLMSMDGTKWLRFGGGRRIEIPAMTKIAFSLYACTLLVYFACGYSKKS